MWLQSAATQINLKPKMEKTTGILFFVVVVCCYLILQFVALSVNIKFFMLSFSSDEGVVYLGLTSEGNYGN